eukprot:m.260710 g.260710  ORF g.260710 m.260710 type:complete len:244 (-) comp15990_c0_seq17:4642-5373(-)
MSRNRTSKDTGGSWAEPSSPNAGHLLAEDTKHSHLSSTNGVSIARKHSMGLLAQHHHLESPPENMWQLMSMLVKDNTGDSIVRYKAEDEEEEEDETMTNKEFVNLCNSNNTTWFELYFDLMFVAYILVLGNLLKSISNDETTGSRWRHLWETNLLFFLGYCYIHITHACHAPAHSRLRCGGSRCRWLTWTHLNMYMASFQPLGMVRFVQFALSAFMMALASVVVSVFHLACYDQLSNLTVMTK